MHQFLPDLAYGSGPRQVLDLYLPERSAPPLFVFIHGGGWRGGDKQFYRPLGQLLATAGFAVALPNHRLAPQDPYPAAADDAAAAVACVLRFAHESGVAPGRVFLGGHSSGAHLASLLALHPAFRGAAGLDPAAIAGVIGISGIYQLERYQSLAGEYLSPVFGADPATYRDASPLHFVSTAPPPFFLAVAEFDYPGAHDQARELAAAVTAAGQSADLVVVPGRDHVTILTGVRSFFDPLALGLTMFLRARM